MDKSAREYYLSLADEAAALFEGDNLREFSDINSYEIKESAVSASPSIEDIDTPDRCHRCDLCKGRILYAKPTLKEQPLILFIAPYAECDRIFSPESQKYFMLWQQALHLEPGEVALSTIIKCPAKSFSIESAGLCKGYLRDEMSSIKPQNIVIFSEDASRYMTRSRNEWMKMRLGRVFNINRIRSFCMPSPDDMITGKASKREVWEDLKAIARAIGIGDRI